MKKILTILCLGAIMSSSYAEGDGPRTKQVCKDVVTNGKTTKQCKTIKVHKKLEGTQVPSEKKK